MQQPFVNAKWIDNIKQIILKILTNPTHNYRLNHLSGNDLLKFRDESPPSHKGDKKTLPESNTNEDMVLQDLFGAINY